MDKRQGRCRRHLERFIRCVGYGLEDARRTMRLVEAQLATQAFVVRSAIDVLKVAATTDKERIVLAMVAVGYIAAADHRRFKSDDAYRAQGARCFRGLTEVNIAKYRSPKTGVIKCVYKDETPRQLQVLGGQLMSAFAAAGIALRMREDTEQGQRAVKSQAATRAICASPEPTA
jgi:hypothetical protein